MQEGPVYEYLDDLKTLNEAIGLTSNLHKVEAQLKAWEHKRQSPTSVSTAKISLAQSGQIGDSVAKQAKKSRNKKWRYSY